MIDVTILGRFGSKPFQKKKEKVVNVTFLPNNVIETGKNVLPKLNKRKIRYMIVGALPVNMYGRNRTSRDLDLAILLQNDSDLDFVFPSDRFRLTYPKKRGEAVRAPVVKFVDKKTGVFVDAIIKPEGFTFDELAFSRKVKVKINNIISWIPSVEDYLISKFFVRRAGSQDFQDIETTMLRQKGNIDWRYIMKRSRELGISSDLINSYRRRVYAS